MSKLRVYTDGACSVNIGAGGYGLVLCYDDKIEKKYGYSTNTTNNRMELIPVIKAIQYAKKLGISDVEILSDSAYVVNCINQKWYSKWKVNNWKTSSNTDVKNVDLWKMLINELDTAGMKVTFTKVKGHSGDTLNTEADRLATHGVYMAKQLLGGGF